MRIGIITIFHLSMMMGINAALAQNDSLFVNTGEFLVGEIKGFDEGIVTIETGYSDSDFKVEWDHVISVKTEQKFVMISTDGDRYYGTLSFEKDNPTNVVIDDVDIGILVVNLQNIVFLKQIDDTFWDRNILSLSAGYSSTTANNSHQFSGNITTGYISSTFRSDLYMSMIRSLQTTEDVTARIRRTEGGLGCLFFIFRDWFGMARADLLQSSEQKLVIRSLTKGGIGHYIVKTNRMNLGMAVGAAWNYEEYDDLVINNRNSVEAFAALEYKIFDLGDLDLLTRINAYPSLTEPGRFRTDFDFSPEYEFPRDFFISLDYSLNYDNQSVEGASSSDYVFQTRIGWEL